MTIVANARADAFVLRPPAGIRLFLVHGGEEGLVHERAKAIVASALEGDADPLRLTQLTAEAVASDPGALSDASGSIPMFGGKRAIWIAAQGRDILAALKPLLAQPPQDCILVVEAGLLKKGAALRNAFENEAHAAAVECYADDARSLAALIEAEAASAGVKISAEARDTLGTLLGADRLTTRTEIAKLLLYVQGRDAIEVADVEASVAGAAPSALDAFIDAAMQGDVAALHAAGDHYLHENGDPGVVVSRLIQRILLLHRLRLEMDNGQSFDAAYAALFVKLPPRARMALARQAAIWTSGALEKRALSMQTVAARVRLEPKLAEMHAFRALWAMRAGPRRENR